MSRSQSLASGPKPLLGREISANPASAEDALKIGAMRHESQDAHEINMYMDAAKRVMFENCMTSCDIPAESIRNFNANFYYNQLAEQKCLQTCYNTKVNLHFGHTAAL